MPLNDATRGSFAADWSEALATRGSLPCMVVSGATDLVEYSYRDVEVSCRRCNAFLTAAGLRPGDVIVGVLPNSAEAVILFLTCLRAGFVYAPISCNATPHELERWLTLCKPRALFHADTVAHSIASLARRPDATHSLAIGNHEWQSGEGRALPELAGKLYVGTSGSTGAPKAIVLNGDRLWESGKAFVAFHRLPAATLRFWNYLPMSYLGGLFNLTLIPIAAGGSFYIDEPFSGKTFLAFWSTVQRCRINALWLVPTILRGLLRLAERRAQSSSPARIEYCFLGTAPIDLGSKQAFADAFGVAPLENFALSETTFFTSESVDTLDRRTPGSVGEVLPYAAVKLRPLQEKESDAGEILVKTPYLMEGYLDVDGGIRCDLDREGFFATGDVGAFDGNTLVVKGRIRDIIKKGGYLIALGDVESLAEQHPQVEKAAACAVAHDFYGESYVLFLELRPALHADAQQAEVMSGWLHGRLSRSSWPERVCVVDAIPVTATGKVRKQELLAQLAKA